MIDGIVYSQKRDGSGRPIEIFPQSACDYFKSMGIFPEIEYFCDAKRHLVCKPYSTENLHVMADNLGIKRCWFHKDHYDIPKRRIEEITLQCNLVDSKEIVKIIRGHKD